MLVCPRRGVGGSGKRKGTDAGSRYAMNHGISQAVGLGKPVRLEAVQSSRSVRVSSESLHTSPRHSDERGTTTKMAMDARYCSTAGARKREDSNYRSCRPLLSITTTTAAAAAAPTYLHTDSGPLPRIPPHTCRVCHGGRVV